MRVVRHWLLREAVAAPSLKVFKARLDGALSNLVWWKVSLPMAGGWNYMIFKVPSNPNHSMILPFCDFYGVHCYLLPLFSSPFNHSKACVQHQEPGFPVGFPRVGGARGTHLRDGSSAQPRALPLGNCTQHWQKPLEIKQGRDEGKLRLRHRRTQLPSKGQPQPQLLHALFTACPQSIFSLNNSIKGNHPGSSSAPVAWECSDHKQHHIESRLFFFFLSFFFFFWSNKNRSNRVALCLGSQGLVSQYLMRYCSTAWDHLDQCPKHQFLQDPPKLTQVNPSSSFPVYLQRQRHNHKVQVKHLPLWGFTNFLSTSVFRAQMGSPKVDFIASCMPA